MGKKKAPPRQGCDGAPVESHKSDKAQSLIQAASPVPSPPSLWSQPSVMHIQGPPSLIGGIRLSSPHSGHFLTSSIMIWLLSPRQVASDPSRQRLREDDPLYTISRGAPASRLGSFPRTTRGGSHDPSLPARTHRRRHHGDAHRYRQPRLLDRPYSRATTLGGLFATEFRRIVTVLAAFYFVAERRLQQS